MSTKRCKRFEVAYGGGVLHVLASSQASAERSVRAASKHGGRFAKATITTAALLGQTAAAPECGSKMARAMNSLTILPIGETRLPKGWRNR